MKKVNKGVTTDKSNVMNEQEFIKLLKIAEKTESVMSDLRKHLDVIMLEMWVLKERLAFFQNEDNDDNDRLDIKERLSIYIDMDNVEEVKELLDECERIESTYEDMQDNIDNTDFTFEQWGRNLEYDWGKSDSLHYDFDEEYQDLIISTRCSFPLALYLVEEAGVTPLRINISQLLITNHSDVA